jgi:hypothetical protein
MTLASAKSKIQKEVVLPIHVIMLHMSPLTCRRLFATYNVCIVDGLFVSFLTQTIRY